MSILETVILGVVEGITEFLPISSTGHLILVSEFLGIPATDFSKTFDIAIQLGAIASVVVLYWRSFLDVEIIKRIVVAFIPTGVIGLALYSFVKAYLLGSSAIVLVALFIGGIALIVFELWYSDEHADAPITSIDYRQSLLIGIAQAVAIIPGVSRSAATIVGGLLLGIPRKTIVEFSFLLAAPTMAAATGFDMLKTAGSFSSADFLVLAVGFVVSFFVALASIKFLLAFIRTNTFISFGVYRIVVAAVFFLVFSI